MKAASKAIEYTETPVSTKVKPGVAVKEIERAIDNFGLGRIAWYLTRRYKFQLSFLVNVYFVGAPLFRFFYQFFK